MNLNLIMSYIYNISNEDSIEQVKKPINNTYKYFAVYRNMVEDLNLEDGECIDTDFSFINTDDPIHKNTYDFVISCCQFLIDNDIKCVADAKPHLKKIFDILSSFSNDNDVKDMRQLIHNSMNVCNFLECDIGIPGGDIPIVLDIMCMLYAEYIINLD